MAILYPQVPLDEWCKRYNIQPKTNKCRKCGKLQTTTIPIASKSFRGLQAELHECGRNYRLATLVSADTDERARRRAYQKRLAKAWEAFSGEIDFSNEDKDK
jgi:hypothetical protein